MKKEPKNLIKDDELEKVSGGVVLAANDTENLATVDLQSAVESDDLVNISITPDTALQSVANQSNLPLQSNVNQESSALGLRKNKKRRKIDSSTNNI